MSHPGCAGDCRQTINAPFGTRLASQFCSPATTKTEEPELRFTDNERAMQFIYVSQSPISTTA